MRQSSATKDPATDPMSDEGRAPVEDEVAGEQHPVLGDPCHHVVGGVCGGAEVMELDEQVVDVEVEAVLEGDERGSGLEVAPLHGLPQPVGPQDPCRLDRLPTPLVADDGGLGQQTVPVGVIAVLVRVHEEPCTTAALATATLATASPRNAAVPESVLKRLDGLEEPSGPSFGGAAVDAQHRAIPEDQAGVVDPPAAVGLDVGVDPVGHLLGPRRRKLLGAGMVVVRRGHRIVIPPAGDDDR